MLLKPMARMLHVAAQATPQRRRICVQRLCCKAGADAERARSQTSPAAWRISPADNDYCNVPLYPGTAVMGVPSLPLSMIMLFLKDCNVPPDEAVPVTLLVMTLPPSFRAAAAPDTMAPALML